MTPLTGFDRIVSLEPGKGAQAIRNIPNTLAIFDSHFPRKPVLPGVLILASLAELSGSLLQEQSGVAWRLGSVQQLRFRHFVQPGDQMELSVELKDVNADQAVLTGSVRVAGQLMVSARAITMLPERTGATA